MAGVRTVVAAVLWWGAVADQQETAVETEMRAAVVINQLVLERMGNLLMDFLNSSQHQSDAHHGDNDPGESQKVAALRGTQDAIENLTQTVSHALSHLQQVADSMTEALTTFKDVGEAFIKMQKATTASVGKPNMVPSHAGCPAPFFLANSECFYVHEKFELNWRQAASFCQRLGGDLAEPTSLEGLVAIINQRSDVTKNNFWLGASDLTVEHRWEWVSGAVLDHHHAPWKPNEPNNAHGNEDCLAMTTDAYPILNDRNCDTKLPFVCECAIDA